jgi:hypothetical protein
LFLQTGRSRADCSWPHSVGSSRVDSSSAAARALARAAGFDELYRLPKKREVLRVVGRIDAVYLYPFARACHPPGLKRNNVAPRKRQLRRRCNRQPQSNAVAANASEHFVGDEVSVKTVDRSQADARQRKKQSVKLCLAAGLACVESQGGVYLGSNLLINENDKP